MRISRKKGTTLIELIVYIGILTTTVLFTMVSILQMFQRYSQARTERQLSNAAQTVLERIEREVRLAKNITSLSNNPTSLVLDSYTDYTVTTAVSKTFSTSTTPTSISLTQGASTYPMLAANVFVRRLFFTQVTTGNKKGIRIDLVIDAGSGKSFQSRTYHAFAMLRQSYTQ